MKRILKRVLRLLYRPFVYSIKEIVSQEVSRVTTAPWDGYIVQDFVQGEYGKAYGITDRDRVQLVEHFKRNTCQIQSGTSALIHTILAREILSIPPHATGDVIECGVWKGASTASLSLVCHLVGRRLLVCDSFKGLPDDGLKLHLAPHFGHYGYYKQGMFYGRLDEVRENIRRFGALDVCDFVPGFFSESLKALSSPLVFAFLDVDLVSSTQDCLRYVWPLLVEGGMIYTDDAGDMDIVRVFFDEAWWRENLQFPPPGYIGSGCGLPLNPRHSSLGYTRKPSQFDPKEWRRVPWLYYPDDENEVQPAK